MEVQSFLRITVIYVMFYISTLSSLPVTTDSKKPSSKSNATTGHYKVTPKSVFMLPGNKMDSSSKKETTTKKTGASKQSTTMDGDFSLSDFDDAFASNDSIDYDYLDSKIPAPKKLIKDDSSSDFPQSELNFQEVHERAKHMRRAEVKETILSKLRLLAPPNITHLKLTNKLKIFPQHMLPQLPDQEDIQQDDNGHKEDTFHAKIETVIQFAEPFPADKAAKYPVTDLAYFTLPDSVSKRNIKQCTLMIYISTPPGQEGKEVKLVISLTQRINKPLVNRSVVLSSNGHWEHIDISGNAIEWAGDDENNYGLVVTALLDGKNLASLEEEPSQNITSTIGDGITTRPHRTPLIKITLSDDDGRYKRSFDEVPLTCDLVNREKRCCRYKFVIDFSQMGSEFDFIIQPRRFQANYCAGTCPTYYLPTDGNSKLMMGLAPAKLQRCCSAVSKGSLKILYINEKGGYMYGEIPAMTIEKCDCS